MSSKKAKGKKKGKKSAISDDPLSIALKKAQNDSVQLRLQLDRRRALTAQARFNKNVAKNAEIEVRHMLDTLKADSKDLAIHMSSQYEVDVSSLNEKISQLQNERDSVVKENLKLKEQIDKLKSELSLQLESKNERIANLELYISQQASGYEEVVTNAFTELTIRLNQDIVTWNKEADEINSGIHDKLLNSELMYPINLYL